MNVDDFRPGGRVRDRSRGRERELVRRPRACAIRLRRWDESVHLDRQKPVSAKQSFGGVGAELHHLTLARPRGATVFCRSPSRDLRRGCAKSRKARNLTGMKRFGEYTKLTGRGEG